MSLSSTSLVALFEAERKRVVSIEQNTLACSYNVRAVTACLLPNTWAESALVVHPSYSDPFRETEDEGRKTAPAFVLRLPSSVQVVKLARTD